MPAPAALEPAGRQSGSTALKQFYVAVSNADVKLVGSLSLSCAGLIMSPALSWTRTTGDPYRPLTGTEGKRTFLRWLSYAGALLPRPPPHPPPPPLRGSRCLYHSRDPMPQSCICSTRDALDALVSGLLSVGSTSVTCLVCPPGPHARLCACRDTSNSHPRMDDASATAARSAPGCSPDV